MVSLDLKGAAEVIMDRDGISTHRRGGFQILHALGNLSGLNQKPAFDVPRIRQLNAKRPGDRNRLFCQNL